MSRHPIVDELDREHLKEKVSDFAVGDTVSVHQKIIEGSKERVQVFTGTVIARKGKGLSETFSLYRVAYGEGMERVFLLHSPRLVQIEVKRRGKVRRGKLYYLRGQSGKKAKVKELIVSKQDRQKAKETEVEEVGAAHEQPETEAASTAE